MGTRSGDIDAAALQYIMKRDGIGIEEMTTILNKKCGLMGVSGVSSDMRDLTAAMEAGNERANPCDQDDDLPPEEVHRRLCGGDGRRGCDRVHRRHRRERRPHPQGGGRGIGIHGRQARRREERDYPQRRASSRRRTARSRSWSSRPTKNWPLPAIRSSCAAKSNSPGGIAINLRYQGKIH